MARKQQTRKRRVKKNIETGIAHIRSTFNNTIVTITDSHGNALILVKCWCTRIQRFP